MESKKESNKTESKPEPVSEVNIVRLRNINDLTTATEWLYSQQQGGTLDATRANAMGNVLKGAYKLRVEVPLKLMELSLKAQKLKATLPPGFASLMEMSSKLLTECAPTTEIKEVA